MIGQTIAAVVSLGGAFLVWTGFALALRRLRGWKEKRAKKDREGIPVATPVLEPAAE